MAITGTGRLELSATNGSTSYVSSLVITSNAGADLSGLASATQFFVATGATITGGAGDDILVGGIGADTILTGAGDNIVHASLGADSVTLGGADTLIFMSTLQSSYGVGRDTITGFGANDLIDVSALFSTIIFAGNFSSDSQGLAALSDGEPTAYFNMTTQRLYIDANFDQQMTGDADMEIELLGLESFQASYLIL